MSWRFARLREARVLARCDGEGKLVIERGRVEIRYRHDDGRAYRASPKNLVLEPDAEILPDDACIAVDISGSHPAGDKSGRGQPGGREAGRKKAGRARSSSTATAEGEPASATAGDAPGKPGGTIDIYTDGSCNGNPGPAGLGVVLDDGSGRRELSVYLGWGTNNMAELSAIRYAAEVVAGVRRPVRIHTDSKYCIGILTRGWKARANLELVAAVKAALAAVPEVSLQYVPGHAGQEANERADRLARQAIAERVSRVWVTTKGSG
jgi:ribonuclease HI